jgi:predicted small secreted protein
MWREINNNMLNSITFFNQQQMKKILNIIGLLACGAMVLTSCNNSNASGNSNSGGSSVSGSGSDTYLEMTNDTKSAQINLHIIFKAYISHGGKARMEMYQIVNDKPSLETVGLSSVDNPGQSTIIDETDKTYSINHLDTTSETAAHTKYTATKIGDEKIMDFDCVHARVIATQNYGGAASFMNSVDTTDLWLSKDVPMAAAAMDFMKKSMQRSMGFLFNAGIANQLKQMGCEGFMVKSTIRSKKSSSVTQLTKLSKDNFSASMFEIPAGYKQTEGM